MQRGATQFRLNDSIRNHTTAATIAAATTDNQLGRSDRRSMFGLIASARGDAAGFDEAAAGILNPVTFARSRSAMATASSRQNSPDPSELASFFDIGNPGGGCFLWLRRHGNHAKPFAYFNAKFEGGGSNPAADRSAAVQKKTIPAIPGTPGIINGQRGNRTPDTRIFSPGTLKTRAKLRGPG